MLDAGCQGTLRIESLLTPDPWALIPDSLSIPAIDGTWKEFGSQASGIGDQERKSAKFHFLECCSIRHYFERTEDMTSFDSITRRSFLVLAGMAPIVLSTQPRKRIPIGLELYSVRDELAKDPMGTVRAVAKMGYEVVEFFSPYYQWTPDYAKEVRKLLDDLNIRCL